MRQRVRARQGRYIRSVLQYSILLQSHDANGFVYKPQVIKKITMEVIDIAITGIII